MASPIPGLVCVTGASGHLGSWLVMRLLERGYRVRATVQDPEDRAEMSSLSNVPGAAGGRLQVFKADLLQERDFYEAVDGCNGVFHLACPTNFVVEDPQKDAIDPAVQGTLNVLKACQRSPSIRRVIHTSSAAAAQFRGKEEPEQVTDDSCWTDVQLCLNERFHGWPYFVAKTLAEQTAFEFAKQNNIDLVSILPALVTGPFLTNHIPNSVLDAICLITGDSSRFNFLKCMSYVHTEDVANAFIFLYEHPEAKGRYICSAADASIDKVANMLSERHPELKIPTELGYLGGIVHRYLDSTKLRGLGFVYEHSLEDMFEDTIRCCQEKGLLK